MSGAARGLAEAIWRDAVAAIDLDALVGRAVARAPDGSIRVGSAEQRLVAADRHVVVALGKAARGMAAALDGCVPVERGLVVTSVADEPNATRLPPSRWEVVVGSHPTPDAASFAAGAKALAFLAEHARSDTIVWFLVSGGGSAVCEASRVDGLGVDEFAALNRVLVRCGATIDEINVVRRRLSATKGGGLARAAADAAQQVSLYLSDVNPNDVDTIASGPTRSFDAGHEDRRFAAVWDRFGLAERLASARLADRIERAGPPPPPPPPAAAATPRSRDVHLVLFDQVRLAEAARSAAAARGCAVVVDERPPELPVQELVDGLIESVVGRSERPVCIVSAGEAVCPVRGRGVGGRNTEAALRAALALERARLPGDVAFLSVGTDGVDGSSPAAGAIVDTTTLRRARAHGLDVEASLAASDSYTFLAALGDALVTGPTGVNVRDLRLLVATAD